MPVRLVDEGLRDPNRPAEYFFGQNIGLYGAQGNFGTNSDILYTRVRIPQGFTVIDMRTYIEDVPSPGGAKTIRMGIYNQADPDDPSLGPGTRVAQTASISISGADDLSFKTAPLESNYAIPLTNWYWLALISTHAAVTFRGTSVAPANFWSSQEESGTSDTLPATASGANVESAIIYIAAVCDF